MALYLKHIEITSNNIFFIIPLLSVAYRVLTEFLKAPLRISLRVIPPGPSGYPVSKGPHGEPQKHLIPPANLPIKVKSCLSNLPLKVPLKAPFKAPSISTSNTTLGPKFFCCSKMAVTRRRKHLFQ